MMKGLQDGAKEHGLGPQGDAERARVLKGKVDREWRIRSIFR